MKRNEEKLFYYTGIMQKKNKENYYYANPSKYLIR